MPSIQRAKIVALARVIDPERAPQVAAQVAAWRSVDAGALATLLATAFPPFAATAAQDPMAFEQLVREGWREPRDRAEYLRRMIREAPDPDDDEAVRRGLRRVVRRERLRIALRELLPPKLGGADVDVTAAETADLAEASIERALGEAEREAERKFGPPLRENGERSRMVVLGMGKLGGRELNVGSDIDVLYVYDTDDGGAPDNVSLHEWWARVARRMTSTLEEQTEDGAAWRVDLRLRPEGSRGAIVNSAAATLRYYEGWGRPWERAALVRARAVAGDLALGADVLDELAPFVYRRRVDPGIAVELARLLLRSREELSRDSDRDLKLGKGGIREAEFFVQALQLIWGGQEPTVRETSTLEAIRKLHMKALVSERESREVTDAYLLLRRLEHRVQWMTGLQTHALPESPEDLGRLARSMGHEGAAEMMRELSRARTEVEQRFASLLPSLGVASPYADLLARIAEDDEVQTMAICERLFPASQASDLARDLLALARRPDDPLGSATADRFPDFGPSLLEAIAGAADPELCARTLRATFARVMAPAVYVNPLAEEPRALRRLVAVLGASAFVGASVQNHPELRDRVIFAERTPTAATAREEVLGDPALAATADADPEDQVGVLRQAKLRLTLDVALSDLSGDLPLLEATRVLSAIADATLEATARIAAQAAPESPRGLAILALGKLGGEELGYGSDLDVVFLYDANAAPPGRDPAEHFARLAQRIVRWVTTPHAAGPGYDLDTRLRPSGAQGMLVTSIESFARYHGVAEGEAVPPLAGGAAAWERQALLRARFSAGDEALGARAIRIAERAAYEGGAPDALELHRLRIRMEAELGKERPGRYNLKTGHGGLTDVEFSVQLLQMRHGRDPAIRTPETRRAIDALEAGGYLASSSAAVLREGHLFLRRLEQRIHIVHASSAQLLDEKAEGLGPLARRMGLRDALGVSASEALVHQYLEMTDRIRQTYAEVVGVDVIARTPQNPAMTPVPSGAASGPVEP